MRGSLKMRSYHRCSWPSVSRRSSALATPTPRLDGSGMPFAWTGSEASDQASSIATRSGTMYVSRLTFHTTPGKTQEVAQALHTLMTLVRQVGGGRPRVLRNHFASLGAPYV